MLASLDDGRWHSTRELILAADVCAVNSIVHELRQNGYEIDCVRDGDAWWYRLEVL